MNKQVIIFGEVLFDCFPDGSMILGGAPFNVAWHLQAFGISPLFISRIGDDKYGKMIATAMENWGMNREGLQIDPHYPTGIVKVTINNGQPSYEIVNHSAYDFIEYPQLNNLPQGAIFYHGTLAIRNQKSLTTLQQITEKINPQIFLDVNLRAPWWELETIKILLEKATYLKLNNEELPLIVPQETDQDRQIQSLFNSYSLTNITLTQGERGALSFERGENIEKITPTPTNQIIDTVGAGDAFCSILILGLVKGWSRSKTLKIAQEFASLIIQNRGATIQDSSLYQNFLQNLPQAI